ncbi:hypothetical protein EV421DRAFT_2022376 [Armillaria borealis]|uniref:Uncharacterized protein n=1 Tax=Armillaria borealis TaxID=47425 RepID=A0AA39J5L5_9AGAR|nr:hypothetical protein EV421DRAFT_2022376 [Armillaria borealis]
MANLKIVVLQNSTIRIFTWKSSRRLDIIPGQAIIFDFSAFIGHPEYRLSTRTFPPTMHEKSGSATARPRSEVQSVLLGDTSLLSLTITIISLTRDVTLPRSTPTFRSRDWDGWDVVHILLTDMVSEKESVKVSACSGGAVPESDNIAVYQARAISIMLLKDWRYPKLYGYIIVYRKSAYRLMSLVPNRER